MDVKKYTWEKTKVNREHFLRKVLAPYMSATKLERVIESESVCDVVDQKMLQSIGNECIMRRCLYVGGMSLGTSMYGGVGAFVLYPLDFAQFAYHAAKLSQELYYLYERNTSKPKRTSQQVEVLLYLLAGADAAITLSGASLASLGQLLYRKGCQKLSMHRMAALPFIGGAIHGSMSAYAMYSLAEEYRNILLDQKESEGEVSAPYSMRLKDALDVEFREAEVKLKHFCNLEKLRELYAFLEKGYIDEQQFEQLKLNL